MRLAVDDKGSGHSSLSASAEDVDQRRLTASRGAHDRDDLSSLHVTGNSVENAFDLGNLGIVRVTDFFGGWFNSDRHVVHDIAPRDADLIVIVRCDHAVLDLTSSGAAVGDSHRKLNIPVVCSGATWHFLFENSRSVNLDKFHGARAALYTVSGSSISSSKT